MASVSVIVDDKIKGKKVMMFSKSSCPYCRKAKAVFQELMRGGKLLSAADYEVMELDDPKYRTYQDYLKKLTGGSTVPRVFVNGKFIGGGDDVVKARNNGSLVKLLQ